MRKTLVFTLSFLIFIIAQTYLSSYINGAPAGYTGSPGDGKTCATSTCHTGSASVVNGWIISSIPEEGYTADSIYTISVSANEEGRTKFGFEFSPQDLIGNQLGTLIPSSQTQLRGAGKYITHKSSSVLGSGSKIWTFEWEAPSNGSGAVNFYAAINCSNNNGTISGDHIYRDKLSVQEKLSVFIDENLLHDTYTVYPNPTSGIIKLNKSVSSAGLTQVDLHNLSGDLVYSSKYSNRPKEELVDLSFLSNGLYILTVYEKGKETHKVKISILK